MKQFTITEKNDWEGETFNYVLMLTDEEVETIQSKFAQYEDEFEDDAFEINETSYSIDDIQKMNQVNKNSYMKFIGFYKLKSYALANWDVDFNPFYKGVGLIEIV